MSHSEANVRLYCGDAQGFQKMRKSDQDFFPERIKNIAWLGLSLMPLILRSIRRSDVH
jgi:hypothetical protein